METIGESARLGGLFSKRNDQTFRREPIALGATLLILVESARRENVLYLRRFRSEKHRACRGKPVTAIRVGSPLRRQRVLVDIRSPEVFGVGAEAREIDFEVVGFAILQ